MNLLLCQQPFFKFAYVELTLNSSSTNGKTLIEMEREIILQRLEETHWRIEGPKGAAQSLGLNPSTLRSRMAKLGIQTKKDQ
jgi:transcriptional regulator with GAF, ATPase, and Fis domain